MALIEKYRNEIEKAKAKIAEQQKKEALNAFRAAAQRLRALGLSAEALASLLTQEEPTDD